MHYKKQVSHLFLFDDMCDSFQSLLIIFFSINGFISSKVFFYDFKVLSSNFYLSMESHSLFFFLIEIYVGHFNSLFKMIHFPTTTLKKKKHNFHL